MFSYIKRVTGNITVRENDNVITVEGIPGEVITKDIKTIWETNRVNANMFLHIDSSSFSFLCFYATDVLYTLEQLTNAEHSLKVSLNTLNKIKEKLLEYTWLARTLEEAPKILDRHKLKEFHLTPLSHQAEFFDVYEKNKYCYNLKGMLLAAAAGSGKTQASLMLMEMLCLDVVIVVCPKPALSKVWEDTLDSAFRTSRTYWISSNDTEPTGKEDFFVVHYEALSKILEHTQYFKNKNVGIILDESHNLNEINSLRSSYFTELCKVTKSDNIIWLSGTPFKAVAIEAIPLLRAIDPLFNLEAETSFKKIFGKSSGRAVDILNNRLGLVSFKVEKKELGLQPPIFLEIKVKIPNSHDYTLQSIKEVMREFVIERNDFYNKIKLQNESFFYECLDFYRSKISDKEDIKLYDFYRTNLKIVIRAAGDYTSKEQILFCNRFEATKIIPNLPIDKKAQFRDIKSIIKYVKLKIQGEALGRVFGALRTKCHVDMVEKINFRSICESTKNKTLVFTSFVEVVEKTQKHLELIGMKPLVVYGKTNNNLPSIISSFEEDSTLNPLIATYKSLSTAVPIVCANVVVLLDSPFRDHIVQQSISRLHRIGQKLQVYVYTCSLDTGDEPNISTRSFEILASVQKAVEEIIGIKSPFVLTDNPEEFEFSLEGLDIEAIESVSNFKPNFINW